MKEVLLILLALSPGSWAWSQNIKLGNIPVELRKDAHSIMREEEIIFELKAIDKASYKVHQVYTILDNSDDDMLSFSQSADRFHSLEDLSIILFDAKGEKIRKYSKKDLTVYNNIGEGLVSDGKAYFIRIPVSSYPVHVQYDYEIKFNGILGIPAYQVQAVGQSVESSSYTAIVPAAMDIRYKEKNIVLPAVVTSEKDTKSYTWKVAGKAALKHEPGSVSPESRYPVIILAPNKFSLDGYDGNMTSWEDYGKWYGTLCKKASNLNSERKTFFNNMVSQATSDRQKAEIIYNYLQQNFRYVLITLGIGGFKPFEASFVDSKKYGDCKALSNYMQACLDAVGIKSHQALINAEYNKEPVDPAFSFHSFNHVILCIPLQKDSVWLECTSNTNEFGVLGSFTENRNALLITEHGGKLVPTPRSKAANNIFSTKCVVKLNEDGSGVANVEMGTSGEYRTHFISKEKKDDQKQYLVNSLGFIQPDDFELKDKPGTKSGYTIEFAFEKVPSFTAGNKMFLNPRIYKIWNTSLPETTNRTQDYYFHHPFIKEDSTIYILPAGFTMEALPETKKIAFDQGNFVVVYNYDQSKNELSVISRLELSDHRIPFAKFAQAKTFFDGVLAEYNGKIVVKKN